MALVERMSLRDRSVHGDGDVVLGDDFVAPDSTVGLELRERRQRRSSFSLRRSPLTRKIITFNLIAIRHDDFVPILLGQVNELLPVFNRP